MLRKVWLFSCLLAIGWGLVACNGFASQTFSDTMTLTNGRFVDYTLEFPASWAGKYEVQQQEPGPFGATTSFVYVAEPKIPLFSLSALTEEQWAEAENAPGVIRLKEKDDVVFMYTITLENLYSGSEADEFQRMAGDVARIAASLEITAVR